MCFGVRQDLSWWLGAKVRKAVMAGEVYEARLSLARYADRDGDANVR